MLLPASSADVLASSDLTSRAGRIRAGMILASKPGGMTARSDASGGFRFENLAPGRYQAVVLTGNDRDRFVDGVFLRNALRSAASITIEADRTANLDLTVSR